MMAGRTKCVAAAMLVGAFVAACGGHGGSVVPHPLTAPHPHGSGSPSASAVFKIKVPKAKKGHIDPRYVSPGTQSMSITDSRGPTTIVNLTPGSPNCVAQPALVCTASDAVLPGTVTFTVSTYDQTNANGNLLSTASLTVVIQPDQANNILITLQGVATSISLVLAYPTPPEGTPTSIPLAVNARDADGYIIVSPGNYQNPIVLTDSDTSGFTSLSTTTVNDPSTQVSVTYTGDVLPGCSATFGASAQGVSPAAVTEAVLIPSSGASPDPCASPSPGGSPSPSPSPTDTPSPTPSPSDTPSPSPSPTDTPSPTPSPIGSFIKHVVIIIQENRTFDNLFNGFPGADTQSWGLDHNGNVIPLVASPLFEKYDLSHAPAAFETEYDNGKLDGFDQEPSGAHTSNPYYAYQYAQQSDVQPYWQLAQQYTLADRMFPDNHGPSFPAHLYIIAGQTGYFDNPSVPWGCDNTQFKASPICYDFETIGDELDSASIPWRYYSNGGNNPNALSIWQPYQAIRHIRFGPDWTNGDIANSNAFFNDVSNGTLAAVSWVSPSGVNSDHAGSGGTFGTKNTDTGPAWVASLVDAVGQSQYWQNTAIFVVWDDWGGWYDHVPPPQVDANGYGFRVPLIIVSPYARHGYVSHVQHEFGSILRFTEEAFGIPSLGTVETRSDDLIDSFDFSQNRTRTRFRPIAHGPYDAVDTSPPDSD